VGATATKTILSAIATGIGGTKNVISQDVLYSNSILAIISKMDADRNQQLSVILQRIQNAGLPPSPDGVDAGQVKTGAPTPVVKSATFTKKVTVATPKTTTTPASTTTTTVETTTPPTKPKPPTTESGVPETEPTFTPYSMHEAAVDLLTYYWAGTIPHALVSMQQVSGAQAIDCKAQVNNLKTTGTKSGSPAELDLSATTPSSPTTVLAAQPKAC
jgi:hypothetical protein